MSLNFTLGRPRDSLPAYGVKGRTRLAALEQPTLTWVFVDEHPDSINNGFFTVWLNKQSWEDLPASSHNGACGFAFADGHSEIKKWRAASTKKPVRYVNYTDWANEKIKHSEQWDLVWLQERTAAK